jgi:hypothetical protein
MGRRIGKSRTLEWAKTLEQFVQGFRMEASEGTVFGQTYYCVKPMGWIWRDFEWRDMQDWCTETMGPTPKDGVWTPNQRWYVNNEQFWFREEADRTMFMMKWV